MKVRNVLSLFFCCSVSVVIAQHVVPDSLLLARAIREQRLQYQRFLGPNSMINNGSVYKEQVYNVKLNQKPYFLSDDWIEGSIIYGGQFFDKIDLQYDLVNNTIIAHPFYSLIKMELVYDRIEQFQIDGHLFVKLPELTRNNKFYDRLVDGRIQLYALRRIEVVEDLSSGKVVHLLIDGTKFFVRTSDSFTEIKGKRDLLRGFPAFKSQIKKQLPKRAEFRKNLEEALRTSIVILNKNFSM